MSFQTAFSSLITKIENNFAYLKNRIDNATGLTIDQIFDGTSQNAQSGVAISGELSNFAKTVNNNQPDANGNISLSIPAAQVQSNWNETNTSSKSYIQNKPSIPSISGLANTDLSNLSATGKTVIDGSYVAVNKQMYSGVNLYNANGEVISNKAIVDTDGNHILPDNGKYLVLFTANVETGASSGNFANCQLNSDLVGNWCYVAGTRTRTNSLMNNCGNIWLPVQNRRISIYRSTQYKGTLDLYVRGYRRIGSN